MVQRKVDEGGNVNIFGGRMLRLEYCKSEVGSWHHIFEFSH